MFTVNDKPVFRFGLQKDQAKLISRYMVKEMFVQGDPGYLAQVWDYLVELPGPDGEPKRLTIRIKGGGFTLPKDGEMVSVVVNRRRTKAHFDADDPKISLGAQYDRGKKEREEKAKKDKAEFERQRDLKG